MSNKTRLRIVVKPGDTLFIFAQVFGITVDDILAVNPGIINPDIIYNGQIISIPSTPPAGPNPGKALAQHLVRSGDTLFFIANQYGINLDELIHSNPQIKDPNKIWPGQVINLVVKKPIPPAPPEGTIQIYVTAGETLFSIARRTGISLKALEKANPQIQDPDQLVPGQIVNVPIAVVAPEEKLTIVVKPGDTLFRFAGIFGITVNDILEVNPGIANPDVLFLGQIVAIPSTPPAGPVPGEKPAQHLVRSGDTLFFIARQYGIDLNALIAANPQIPNPDFISINQVINLVVEEPLPSPLPEAIRIYVTAGETLTSIARRTGVSVKAIIKANPQIEDPDRLVPGQIVNVPLKSGGKHD